MKWLGWVLVLLGVVACGEEDARDVRNAVWHDTGTLCVAQNADSNLVELAVDYCGSSSCTVDHTCSASVEGDVIAVHAITKEECDGGNLDCTFNRARCDVEAPAGTYRLEFGDRELVVELPTPNGLPDGFVPDSADPEQYTCTN